MKPDEAKVGQFVRFQASWLLQPHAYGIVRKMEPQRCVNCKCAIVEGDFYAAVGQWNVCLDCVEPERPEGTSDADD